MHLDESVLLGELERVADEIEQNLDRPPLVREHLLEHERPLRVDDQVQFDVFVFGLEADDLEGLLDDVHEVELRNVEGEGVVLELAQVEQVIDEVVDHKR